MDKKPLIVKWLATGIILLFIGTYIIPAMAQNSGKQSSSRGNWLYVGGGGLGNYSTIQDAVDDASDGDTVFVYDDSSPYFEQVKIHKSIALLGENRETTIIDAKKNGSPIILEANNVIVCGFTIQNSSHINDENAGISIKNSGETTSSNNNKIIGNNIINNLNGVYEFNSTNNTIADNIILGNPYAGIFLDSCDLSKIQNNTITRNNDGVKIYDSNYVQLNKNIIDDNYDLGVLFTELINVNRFNIITNNSITNNRYGLTIMGERNTVKNNYIANNSLGVRIRALDVGSRTEWNIIQSNIIANNSEIGLYLETAIWCRISRNNFIGNTVHASFIYEPFFCYFIQMNTFYRNYWEEDNLTTPKVIQGDILCFFWLAMFNAFLNMVNDRIPMIILPKTMPWKNYDWSPAQEPYDISGMS